ncbi:hypothetical protein D9619_007631 [Psilocybe cf. subviscida]|uniref:Uncharacterized protein n=1 Tax=Psilocybe cf. subviscida TaxID=2480587 RepID=A0A8H5AUK6_9AGAR|nr:hypothetical protein D9619_007631 [Psilocybe cf. subviscida]
MSIQLETATLVSIFVESILYGFFLFLFSVSSAIIWCRHCESSSTRRTNLKLFLVSFTMFAVSTVHIGTGLHRVLHAFMPGEDRQTPGETLKATNTACYLAKMVAYAFQVVLGDGFMIYRLYMVWNGNNLVCLPAVVIFLGGIAAATGSIHHSAMSPVGNNVIFAAQARAWIIPSMLLTFLTNAYSTALIAGRLWWVPHKINGMLPQGGENQCNLGPAAVIIIESGVVYSSCMIILIALYASGSYAQNIVLDALTQIIGIVFSIIIVRVAVGVSDATPLKRASTTLNETTSKSPFSLGIINRVHWPGTTSKAVSAAPATIRTDQWRSSGAHWHSLSADMFHAAQSRPHGFISVNITRSNDAGYASQESTVTVDETDQDKVIGHMEGGAIKSESSVDHSHHNVDE